MLSLIVSVTNISTNVQRNYTNMYYG